MNRAATKDPAIPPHLMDPDALKVVRRLQSHGHEAYLVGGCVRDLLLEVTPKDFDVATSATPRQVKRLFRNCRIIGRRFRLAHIIFKGRKIIETATFRCAPRQKEGAEGEELIIWQDNEFGTAEEDAYRRDFTINGLFYDPVAGEVIDFLDGVKDVTARVIRTIGDPGTRLPEDPVRIIRAIKFAVRLDLDISPSTVRGMVEHRGLIASCSVARVLEEIYRMLGGGKAEPGVRMMHRYGVLPVLFPELGALMPLPRSLKARQPVLPLRHKGDRWWAPPASKGEEMEEQERLEHHQEQLRRLLGLLLGDEEKAWRAAGRTLMPLLTLLDELAASREEPMSHGLLLAVALCPLASRPLDEPLPISEALDLIEELVQAVSSRLCISRRDRQRMQQILAAQVRMTRPGRRARPKTLLSSEYFQDAFALLKLRHQQTGLYGPAVERWTALASGAPPNPRPPRRHQRRRGRRRRRRSGPNDNKQ